MTQADRHLNNVYETLNIAQHSDEEKYNRIDDIVNELQSINNENTINAKTTGTLSERLCELALKASVTDIYKSISDKWNWMADFSVLGHPFNLLISVKSFKAKERLLVSGSGNILSPTVGWGLFDDPAEWTEDRVRLYLYRSFIAIYMPSRLYALIPQESKSINNINGKSFLRELPHFTGDLRNAIKKSVIDVTAF